MYNNKFWAAKTLGNIHNNLTLAVSHKDQE